MPMTCDTKCSLRPSGARGHAFEEWSRQCAPTKPQSIERVGPIPLSDLLMVFALWNLCALASSDQYPKTRICLLEKSFEQQLLASFHREGQDLDNFFQIVAREPRRSFPLPTLSYRVVERRAAFESGQFSQLSQREPLLLAVPLQEMAKEVARSRCRHPNTIATTSCAFKSLSDLHSIRVLNEAGGHSSRPQRSPGNQHPARVVVRASDSTSRRSNPISSTASIPTEGLCLGA
jgi:hypothetical protein